MDDLSRLLVGIFATQLCGAFCALQGMLILEAVLIHCSVLFSSTSGLPRWEWLLSDGMPDPPIPIECYVGAWACAFGTWGRPPLSY